VIIFYGLIVILVLVIRVKPKPNLGMRTEVDRKLAECLIRDIHEHTVTKTILEQLKDQEYRAKAWQIYSSDKRGSRSLALNQSLLRKEPDILKTIDKRIETIERRNEFLILSNTIGTKNQHFHWELYKILNNA
jgi:hypothetical protein